MTAVMSAGFFLTFIIIGVWHGFAFHYLFFGVLHGAGMTAHFLYSQFFRTLPKETQRKYLKSRPIEVAAIILTFLFCSLCLVSFENSLPELKKIFELVSEHYR